MQRSDLLILSVPLPDGRTWTTAVREVQEIILALKRHGYAQLRARVDRWTPTGFRNGTEATMYDGANAVVGWKHVETFEWPLHGD